MPYYRVAVNRYTTNIQRYYVNVNTDCPEHAKEMASEVLEAHLEGEDHELAGFKPEAFGEKEEVAEDFEVDVTSEPDLCEYTEDLFINNNLL